MQLVVCDPRTVGVATPTVGRVGGHHIVVAHQRESARSFAEFADDGQFGHARRIGIGDFFNCKTQFVEDSGRVLSDFYITSLAFGRVGDKLFR